MEHARGLIVKNHHRNMKGKLMVVFELQSRKTRTILHKTIFMQRNGNPYIGPWRSYVESKGLPSFWSEMFEEDVIRRPVIIEQAEIVSHLMDKRGLVFMNIKWEDGRFSQYMVKKMLRTPFDKKVLEGPWNKYCTDKNYKNEMFQKQGIAVVKTVVEHKLSTDSRPEARLEWCHGEEGWLKVKIAMENKKDMNNMKAAWKDYCQRIENNDLAFLKGNMVKKDKRGQRRKKRRRLCS